MDRCGYIYVLATGYQDSNDQQIIKIVRTSRSPAARVRELSRGGPTGMVLVGAVPCRDMVELEKRVHQYFHHSRFRSDGGTEYFTARPDDALNWLRTETPRLNLESARKNAWAEYANGKPFIIRSRLNLLFIISFIPVVFLPLAGLLIQPFHFWSIFVSIVGPLLAALAFGAVAAAYTALLVAYIVLARMMGPKLLQHLSYMQNADLQSLQRELEIKYHLLTGGVWFS